MILLTLGRTSCPLKFFEMKSLLLNELNLVIFMLLCNVSNGGIFSNAIFKAVKRSLVEMEIEDNNAVHKIGNHLVRRLIVMPLTDEFDPCQASEMHGKIQYGDKCSLPASLGRIIFEKAYEVPWLFEVTPVRAAGYEALPTLTAEIESVTKVPFDPYSRKVSKAYISPLDFRSPESYIFFPKWLMHSLGLKSHDQVDISFVRIKLASLVILQPLSPEWDTLIEGNHDPKAILEGEINKYSSLTADCVISIKFQNGIYPFYVKEVQSGGVATKAVRIQDSDVKVDINRELLDDILEETKNSGTQRLLKDSNSDDNGEEEDEEEEEEEDEEEEEQQQQQH